MQPQRSPSPDDSISVNGISFSHHDIYQVVDEFYTLIQEDPVLYVPFGSVHDWPEHIRRLTHFWWIRMGGRPYISGGYDPVSKHFQAGFNEAFLARWLMLFHNVLRKNLKPDQAAFWISLSERMGHALSMKNEMYRNAYEHER